MFKDTKKELERLEAELLAEQEEPEEVEEYEEWEEKIEELQDIIDEITDAIENLEEDSDEGRENGLNITITLNTDEDSSEKISILKSLFNTKKTEE